MEIQALKLKHTFPPGSELSITSTGCARSCQLLKNDLLDSEGQFEWPLTSIHDVTLPVIWVVPIAITRPLRKKSPSGPDWGGPYLDLTVPGLTDPNLTYWAIGSISVPTYCISCLGRRWQGRDRRGHVQPDIVSAQLPAAARGAWSVQGQPRQGFGGCY